MYSNLVRLTLTTMVASSLATPVPASSGHQKKAVSWQWDVRTTVDPGNGSAPLVVDEIFEFSTKESGEMTFRSVSKTTAPAAGVPGIDNIPTAAPPTVVVKSTIAPAPAKPPTTTLPKVGTSTALPSSSPPPTTSTTSPFPAAPTTTDSSFIATVLTLHNVDRALHGAKPLTWNTTLASFAQNWLKACIAKHSGGPYGENLAWGYETVTAAIQAWYDEYKQYSYSNPVYAELTGHYTQMVWKDATEIGCALQLCDGTGNILLCEYDKGNVIGEFASQVLPQLT